MKTSIYQNTQELACRPYLFVEASFFFKFDKYITFSRNNSTGSGCMVIHMFKKLKFMSEKNKRKKYIYENVIYVLTLENKLCTYVYYTHCSCTLSVVKKTYI